MAAAQFKPGFRISALDAGVLIAGAAGSALAAQIEWWMGSIIGFAVGHFFLFCNVFRVQRPFELAWAVLFILLAGSTIAIHMPGWGMTIATSLTMTAAIIAMEMRKFSYHGILWQRINPGLPKWWEAQGGDPDRHEPDLDEQIRPIVVSEKAYRAIRGAGVVLALIVWGSVLFWGPVMFVVGFIPYWISIKLFVPSEAV